MYFISKLPQEIKSYLSILRSKYYNRCRRFIWENDPGHDSCVVGERGGACGPEKYENIKNRGE